MKLVKTNRFLQNRKGITPILSNLLLTIIAVAAMSIATTATYVITTNLRETMSERIIVEDLWFTPPDRIGIYIRNIGKVNFTLNCDELPRVDYITIQGKTNERVDLAIYTYIP